MGLHVKQSDKQQVQMRSCYCIDGLYAKQSDILCWFSEKPYSIAHGNDVVDNVVDDRSNSPERESDPNVIDSEVPQTNSLPTKPENSFQKLEQPQLRSSRAKKHIYTPISINKSADLRLRHQKQPKFKRYLSCPP